jgi:DNA-binding LytR/AlgR family response regulator
MSARKIRVLIADDEAPARKRLHDLFSDYGEFEIIGEAENGDQVLKLIEELSPQVAFLDINMPGASVFNTIPTLKEPPHILFQTAYSEYGAKAFDINAVDYLLKPVSRSRFEQAIGKLKPLIKIESPKDVIPVKSGESIRIVKIETISRISFDEGFSFIYSKGEKIYSDRSLNHYEELLAEKGFYRISRSDLINLQFIEKLHPLFKGQYTVELTGGHRIIISRRRIQGLKQLIY